MTFTVIFALLQWSGTEPLSLRYACNYGLPGDKTDALLNKRILTTTSQIPQTKKGPQVPVLPWPLTVQKRLCLHLQPDLDEVHGPSQPDRDHTGHHAGQEQVRQCAWRTGLGFPAAVLAEEPLRVTEDPKHHGVVDGNAGKGEGHALEEAKHLQ